jgi:hypothetical protein
LRHAASHGVRSEERRHNPRRRSLLHALYYAQHKLLPGKTRVFVDFVMERFREQGLDRQFDALA